MKYIDPCAWFAGCGRRATGFMPHPVLGDLPICERCRKIVEANR